MNINLGYSNTCILKYVHLMIKWDITGAEARSVMRPLRLKVDPRSTVSSPARSFVNLFATSRRASFQFLAKECALNTGKLLPGGLPRNRVVK